MYISYADVINKNSEIHVTCKDNKVSEFYVCEVLFIFSFSIVS